MKRSLPTGVFGWFATLVTFLWRAVVARCRRPRHLRFSALRTALSLSLATLIVGTTLIVSVTTFPATPAGAAGTRGVITQAGYIWENDDQTTAANANNNSAQAAGNAAITGVRQGERLNLRTQVKNTGAAAQNNPFGLFYDRNDGYFTRVQGSTSPVTGASNCTDTNFACTLIDSAGGSGTGRTPSIAIGPDGAPWAAFQDLNSYDLRLAHYVGTRGTGCANTTAWTCVTIDSAGLGGSGLVGAGARLSFDPNGRPWIAYSQDDANPHLRVARYVGAAGTGCAAAGWTCEAVTTPGSYDGFWPSVAFDGSGVPWITYYTPNSGTQKLNYVRFAPAGNGTGCNTANWTGCAPVDRTGDVGVTSALAFDTNGTAWVTYRDNVNGRLKLARYNSGGTGTGCGSGVTLWDCSVVDNAAADTGHESSLNFAPDGTAWVSYNDLTNGNLRVARYVGTGGTSACGSAFNGQWLCSTADGSANAVGRGTSMAFDAVGVPWIVHGDSTALRVRLTRYVGTGGNCAGNTAWACSVIDNSGNSRVYPWMAFDNNGVPWIAYTDDVNKGLKVINLSRRGEITMSPGLAGSANTNVSITSSHADMTAVGDSANKSDADCIGGGTWTNGRWNRASEVNLSLGASQCTELGWMLDTSQASASTTYRFVTSMKDGTRTDRSPWRGPATVSQYASLSTGTAGATRVSKDTTPDMPECASSTWECAVADTNTLTDLSMAFAPDGTPWYSGRRSNTLYVGRYVGTGGNCSNAAWQCDTVAGSVSVGTTKLVFDHSGTAIVSYTDNDVIKTARYVGSSGANCTSSAWTCNSVFNARANEGAMGMVLDPTGNPWLSATAPDRSVMLGRYVGSGGTGCLDAAWTCSTIIQTDYSYEPSLAFDNYGNPAVAFNTTYPSSTGASLRFARYVGVGGNGCGVTGGTAWNCEIVKESLSNVTATGELSSLTFDSNNTAWISAINPNYFGQFVAKYVGTGGAGSCSTGITAWSCSTVVQEASSYPTQMTTDATGTPWVLFDKYRERLSIAQYVGSGGNCPDTAWYCTEIDTVGSGTKLGEEKAMAWDRSGVPWVVYGANTANATKVARLKESATPHVSVAKKPYAGSSATTSEGRYRLDSGGSPRGTCAATADARGYCGVAAADADSDSITALANETPMFSIAAANASNATHPIVTWTGQSTVAPSSRNLHMKVWRFGTTNDWVTVPIDLNSCATAGANTSCTISGVQGAGAASEYWESVNGTYYAYARVFQASSTGSATTMKTDVLKVTPNTGPVAPTSLAQTKTDLSPISVGGLTNESTVRFTGLVADSNNPDGDELCVEVQPIGTPFTYTNTACGPTRAVYTGSPVTATVSVSGLGEGQYHWQARTRDSGSLVSSWTEFNGGAGAFTVDLTAPVLGTVRDGVSAPDVEFNTGSLTQMSGNWSGFSDAGSGLARYTYSIGTTPFGTDVLSPTNTADATVTSVSPSTLSLSTGIRYYYTVTATDVAGNTTAPITTDGQLVRPYLTLSTAFHGGSCNGVTQNAASVGPGNIDFGTLSLGGYSAGAQDITGGTNAKNGYSVYVSAPTPVQNQSGNVLPAVPGTNASPAAFPALGTAAVGYTTNDATLGTGIANRFTSGVMKWASLSTSNSEVAYESGPVTSSTNCVAFQAGTSATTPAGTYKARVVYTAVPSF